MKRINLIELVLKILKEEQLSQNSLNFTKVKIYEPAGTKVAFVQVPKSGSLLRNLMEQLSGRKIKDVDLAHNLVSFAQFLEVYSWLTPEDFAFLKDWINQVVKVEELRS